MQIDRIRRAVVAGIAGSLVAGFMPAMAQDIPPLPSSPVQLNIVDVAGNLALTQEALENYRKKNEKLVSRITFTKAPSPELAGKIRAQQQAGRLDIDLILTGTDALAAGIKLDLWLPVEAMMEKKKPGFATAYLEPAAKMQALAEGKGVVVNYYPSGPLLEYNPEKVKTPPATAEELLAWAKANPNKFFYGRPANSGPGRTFLMGLPYILGDKDPMDPEKGWDKTWAYLKELGNYIEYYPAGTGPTMKELGEGTRDIIVSTTGWDINPRVLGTVPKEFKVSLLKGFTWVTDAHYMVVPKGIAPEKLAVVMDMMAFMLEPAQQAYAYDEGYFYPGPAVKDVPLSMAPAKSQAAIKEYGRPEYDAWIADNPKAVPLGADAMVAAFRRWDSEIGAAKQK